MRRHFRGNGGLSYVFSEVVSFSLARGFQAQGGAAYSNKRSLWREGLMLFDVGRASGTKRCRLLWNTRGVISIWKLGGAKSSGNAGDPMLGVAVIP